MGVQINSNKKRFKKANVLDAGELENLNKETDSRVKSEQLDLLNRKVKHFEDQVAREE